MPKIASKIDPTFAGPALDADRIAETPDKQFATSAERTSVADSAKALKAYPNEIRNGALVASGSGISWYIPANASIQTTADPVFTDRGITDVLEFTVANTIPLRQSYIQDMGQDMAGRFFIAAYLVYSADGVTWPSPVLNGAPNANASGLIQTASAVASFTQIDANHRLIFRLGQFGATAGQRYVVWGFYDAGGAAVPAAVRVSGFAMCTSRRAFTSTDQLRYPDWTAVGYAKHSEARVEAAEGRLTAVETSTGSALASSATAIAVAQSTKDSLASVVQTIGRTVDPVAGSAASANTFVFADPVTKDGYLSQFKINSAAPGTVQFARYLRSGTAYTRVALSPAIAVPAGPKILAPADFGNFPLTAGEYIGVLAVGALQYNNVAADGSGWQQVSGALPATFNQGVLVTSPRLEVSFQVSAQTVTSTAVTQASADAAAAKVTADALSGQLTAVVPQVIGRPTAAALASGSAIANQVYVSADPVANTGTLTKLDLFAMATGTITVRRYTKAGNTLTPVGSVTGNVTALGDTSVVLNGPVNAGEYLGVQGTGIAAYTTGSQDSSYYFTGSAGGTATVQSGYLFQLRYNITATVQVVSAAAVQALQAGLAAAATVAGSLDLSSVDKIVMTGNSYNEFIGGLMGKSPTCVLSSLSEYNWGNLSQGGADAAAIATNLATNVAKFGTTFAAQKPSRAIFMETTNSKGGSAMTDAAYYAAVQKVIDVHKSLGAEPIIATEWAGSGSPTVDGEQRNVRGLRALADANGVRLIDVAAKSRTMNVSQYGPFWKSNHPVTRTTWLMIDGLRRGLKQLPRPRASMKLFRVRGTTTVGAISDLLFRTIEERHRLYREIYIGHTALSEAQKVNYDVATGLYDGTQTVNDEYMRLIGGNATSFGTYALLDAVLPVIGATGLKLTISDTSCTVYARKMTSTGVSWVQLTPANGVFIIPDGAGLVDRDRLALLIYKSGGVSLNASPLLTWTGGVARNLLAPAPLTPPRGAELLAQPLTVTGGAVPAQWTNSGALPAVVPVDSAAFPAGVTGCVEVTSASGLAQPIAYTSSDDPGEVVVRVWARRFPAPFNPAADFTTAPINYETCDTGTLLVTLSGASGIANASAILKDQVGLWWSEVEFRATLPAGTTATTIDVRSADDALQIAKVSVRSA